MSETQALATRAVASKHWRWMPGMLAVHDDWQSGRVVRVDDEYYHPPALDVAWEWWDSDGGISPHGCLPVLSDPATLGCLLALVQEAHGALVWLAPETEPDPLDDSEYVLADRLSWLVWVARDGDYIDVIGHGLTPAAALVAALETEWPDWRATKGGKR